MVDMVDTKVSVATVQAWRTMKFGSTVLHLLVYRNWIADRFILHDQPVPGGHCHAVLRDEETRNGTDAARTGPLSVDVDAGQHVSQRIGFLLPSNHQVHCPLVAEEQETLPEAIPGLPQSEERSIGPAKSGGIAAAGARAQFADAPEAATRPEEAEKAEQASASRMPTAWCPADARAAKAE